MIRRNGTNPYRSREDARSEIVDRVDPVVWGNGSGPLDAGELASYADLGFLVKPSLFDEAEIASLLDEANHLADRADPTADDVVVEPGSNAIRSVFRVHRESDPMRGIARDPRLTHVARQILGGDVYVHQSRINFKPPFEGKSFPWHSDFETWHIEDGMPRMRALSVSILLSTNVEQNGPLMLIPGSHRRYVRCVGATPAEHFRQSLRKQQYGVPDAQALTELARERGVTSAVGPPGTAVFFDCNTMHGSTANITHLPRHNIFFVYNSVDNRLVAPFGGTVPRPDFLAEREPSPTV